MNNIYEIGEKFYFPTGNRIEKHTVTGFYKLDGNIHYIFSPEGRVSTQFKENMFKTFIDAKSNLVNKAEDIIKKGEKQLEEINNLNEKDVIFYTSDTSKEVLEEKEKQLNK